MKKNVLGIIIGVIIGIALTFTLQYAWNYYQYLKYKDASHLFEIAKFDLEHKLKGSQSLNVVIGPNSRAKVNYKYEKLYDVEIRYERDGKIKQFITQYGISNGTWIAPDTADFAILDDKADILYVKFKRPEQK